MSTTIAGWKRYEYDGINLLRVDEKYDDDNPTPAGPGVELLGHGAGRRSHRTPNREVAGPVHGDVLLLRPLV